MNANRNEIFQTIHLGDQARDQNDLKEALRFYLTAGSKCVKHEWGIDIGRKVRAVCSADINDDNDDEVIIGSEDSKIHVLNNKGASLWSFTTGGWVLGVGAADVDGDGAIEVLAGSDKLYIFDSHGGIKKTIETPDNVTSLWVGMMPGREAPLVITGHDDGVVIGWNPQGALQWRFKTPRRVICVLAEDIDGDGKTEFVIGSENKYLYILDENGDQKDTFPRL